MDLAITFLSATRWNRHAPSTESGSHVLRLLRVDASTCRCKSDEVSAKLCMNGQEWAGAVRPGVCLAEMLEGCRRLMDPSTT